MNPARVLGPAMVFHCYWSTAFVYVFAEYFGALIAAALVVPLYGVDQLGTEQAYAWLGISMPRHAMQVALRMYARWLCPDISCMECPHTKVCGTFLQLPQHVRDVPASQPVLQSHQAYVLSEGRSKSAGPLIPTSMSAAHSAPVGTAAGSMPLLDWSTTEADQLMANDDGLCLMSPVGANKAASKQGR